MPIKLLVKDLNIKLVSHLLCVPGIVTCLAVPTRAQVWLGSLDLHNGQQGYGKPGAGATVFAQTSGSFSRNLNIGSGGITIGNKAGAVTFGSTNVNLGINALLSASQTWTNNSSNVLTVDTIVQTGSGSLPMTLLNPSRETWGNAENPRVDFTYPSPTNLSS
jgi:hypothetical protein